MFETFLLGLAVNISTEIGKEILKSFSLGDTVIKELEKAYTASLNRWTINEGAKKTKERQRKECEKLLLEIYRGNIDYSRIDKPTSELLKIFDQELCNKSKYPLANEFMTQKKEKHRINLLKEQNDKLNSIANEINGIYRILSKNITDDYSNDLKVLKGSELQPQDILQDFRCNKSDGYNDLYYTRNYLDNNIYHNLSRGKNVLITGISYSGKSRAAYEILKNEFPNSNIVLPNNTAFLGDKIYQMEIQNFKDECIWVFDDIDLFICETDIKKKQFAIFIEKLISNPLSHILATCRRDKLDILKDVFCDKDLMVNFSYLKIKPLTKSQQKLVSYKYSIGNETNPTDTIGSFFLPIKRYEEFYDNRISFLAKQILWSCKVIELWRGYKIGDKELIQEYCKKRTNKCNDFGDADWDEFFLELRKFGFIERIDSPIRVDEGILNLIIEPTVTEFDIAKEVIKYYPETIHFNKLILRFTEYEDSYRLFNLMKPEKSKPNIITYKILINKCRSYSQALEFLKLMLLDKIIPDKKIYSLAINKCKNYLNGEEIIELMKSNNIIPDQKHYTKIINHCNSYSESKNVLALIKTNNIKPDIYTYTALINKCSNYGEVESVLKLMEQDKIVPNEYTYTALISKCNTYSEAKIIVESMLTSVNALNIIVFNSLINKCKTYSEGMEVLKRMKSEDINPDRITFTTLIKKCKDYNDGILILESMLLHDLKPDRITFTTLIERCNSYQKGMEVFELMESHSVIPDEIVFNSLIKICNSYQEREQVFELMQSRNIVIDKIPFDIWIKESNNYSEAIDVYNKLINLKIEIDEGLIVSLLMKCNNNSQLIEINDIMQSHKIGKSQKIYSQLIRLTDDYDSAFSLIEEMQLNKIIPNEYHFSSWLTKAVNKKQADYIIKYMETKFHLKPNDVIMRIYRKITTKPNNAYKT